MFNARPTLFFLLFVIAIGAGYSTGATGQVLRKCADFNEYCQNHWDCCSNSCHSYLSRCTRNYQNFPNYPNYPISFPFFENGFTSPKTLEEILELNFGNIKDNIDVRENDVRPRLNFRSRFADVMVEPEESNEQSEVGNNEQVQEAVVTERNGVLRQLVLQDPQSEKEVLIEVVPLDATTKMPPANNADEFQMATTTKAEPVTATEAQIQFAERVDATTDKDLETGKDADADIDVVTATVAERVSPTTASKCLEIGSKCYRHEECCTQRCHGFLHQCVT